VLIRFRAGSPRIKTTTLEGDYIKLKGIALLLAAAFAAGIFAGCGKKPEPSTPFAVYNVNDEYEVRLGDRRADVEPTLAAKGDIDMAFVIEFVEENIERWKYEGNEGISLNYDLSDENKVCAIRIETDEWELPNGLRVGMTPADISSMYDKDMIFKFKETADLWLGYDENGNLVPFEYEPPVPFLIRFDFSDGKSCDRIVIQDNRPVGSIF
jgi:hypothetical protein